MSLMLALAKIGRNDVACRLIHNDTFPSWGFSIKHSATSIWARWNIMEAAVVLPAKHAKHTKRCVPRQRGNSPPFIRSGEDRL
ncbi:MAG: hypothetical protein HZA88_17290, partial [Verrucomicrobia bacterium]|nr:hypothetical protein [Verrucomicrobiota bacterium]